MSTAYDFVRLNKNDSVLLVVDHQEGLFELVQDWEPDRYRTNVLAHAAIGKVFDLPVILTSSTDNGESLISHSLFSHCVVLNQALFQVPTAL